MSFRARRAGDAVPRTGNWGNKTAVILLETEHAGSLGHAAGAFLTSLYQLLQHEKREPVHKNMLRVSKYVVWRY
jgi:hypothetical protein